MFKQQYVRLLIVVSILIWVISIVHFYWNSFKNNNPYQLQYALQEDITHKTGVIDKLLNASNFDLNTLRRDIPQDVFFYVYQNDKIIDWNNNNFLPNTLLLSNNTYELVTVNNARVLAKRFDINKDRKLLILIPLFLNYPIENEYLKAHFIANEFIPNNTILSNKKLEDGFELRDNKNKIVAYAKFDKKDIKSYPPGYLDVILVVIAVFFTYATINIFNLNFSKKRSQWKGLLFSILIISFFRISLIVLGIPFNARSLDLFSPNLFYINFIVSSLGDLFFNALGFMWIVSYVYKHTEYRFALQQIKARSHRFLLLILFIFFAVILFYRSIYLTHSLIIDKKISFDISNINSINFQSFVGLLTMCLLSGAAALTLNICNYIFNNLSKLRLLKYGLLIFTLFIFSCVLPADFSQSTTFCIIGWVILYVLLLDLLKFRIVADVTNLKTIYWLLFICFSFISFFLYVEYKKEFLHKVDIIKSLSYQNRDLYLENTISLQQDFIDRDSLFLKSLTSNADDLSNKSVQLLQRYMLNANYDLSIELLDSSKIHNKRIFQNNFKGSFLSNTWRKTDNPKLFYKDVSEHLYEYCYLLPSAITSQHLFYIHLKYKINKNLSYFPEILLNKSTSTLVNNDFAIAKYYNNKLVFQTNKNQFPFSIPYSNFLHSGISFKEIRNQYWIFYKKNKSETFIIIHDAANGLDILLLFSFFFGIGILFILFITIYRFCISFFINEQYKKSLIVFNYVKKTHYAILSLALFSFLILSIFNIIFLHNRYTKDASAEILISTRAVQEQIQNYLYANKVLSFSSNRESPIQSMIQSRVNNVSTSLQENVSIYSSDYLMFASSLDVSNQNKLFSAIMSDKAKMNFLKTNASYFLLTDKIGNLNYQVAYMKLLNYKGECIGYISVSKFASHAEIHQQLNYLIFSLAKLYAFVFFLATFLSFLITRGLTNSFNIIIKKLRSVNLQGNEILSWPFDDEIGLLVSEYNKMISKLEQSAHVLAQSEREHAWKEMAQQVAHEIKNPLTPMRLNLQFLQNALKNNQANTTDITKRVTESLIEQIDNLNYIASEFSSFARMPDPKVEVFNVVTLLEKCISIYKYENAVSIFLELPPSPVFIKSDKSQLLRVFGNVFQNAVQAIPDGRKGVIKVKLSIINNYAIIVINDNGVGISPSVKTSMFMPHFTTKNSGSGIGLAMSKRIIEYWNGAIWFESIENIGTDFFIKIPILEQTVT